MDSNFIIDSLGGTADAARFFEVKPPSVSAWRQDGIPRARLMYLRAVRPEIFQEAERLAAQTAAPKRAA